MAGVTATTGLFSGIDSGSLITQLMSLEARPKTLIQIRVQQLQFQQAAYLDLNSRLSALKTAAAAFRTDKTFQKKTATSSDTDTLTATAGTNSAAGTYTFLVDRLVSTQQMLSGGYANKDSASVGATSITFESTKARLDRDVNLSDLNGGQGVSRGKIVITDSTGTASTVDLSRTVTVGEVLDAINNNGTARVAASVQGGKIIIKDTGGGGNTLRIADAVGFTTATSLGINKTAAGTILEGNAVYSISANTPLAALNDNNGVAIKNSVGSNVYSFTLNVGGGTPAAVQVNLGDVWAINTATPPVLAKTEGAVTTVGGVVSRINAALDAANVTTVRASIDDTNGRLLITDSTGTQPLTVTENGSSTAADLGLTATPVGGNIQGERIFAGLNSTLASGLNGGQGIAGDGQLSFKARDGTQFNVTIDRTASLTDIFAQIETASGIGANGKPRISLSLDSKGTGVRVTDNTATGDILNNLIIEGTSGSDSALSLGISTGPTGVATSTKSSGNLQRQYIATSTLLSSLNNGKGIGTGKFRITDATGASALIDIDSDSKTLADLISEINGATSTSGTGGLKVKARINAHGDGIEIYENNGTDPTGPQKIKIEDVTGAVAKGLNIAGTATGTGVDNKIDGTYERTLTLTAADTLQTVADKINAAKVGASASIINDGTGITPFRLNITSQSTGESGRFIIDSFGADLGLSTLDVGHNSRVFFGSTDPARAVAVVSSTNTVDTLIPDVKIDLKAASTEAVTLNVATDNSAITSAVKQFVSAFNTAVDRITFQTKYDVSTEKAGALLGDGTTLDLRTSLFSTLEKSAVNITGQFDKLSDVGIKITSGGHIELNEDKLREALGADPEGVTALFAARVQANDTFIDVQDGVRIRNPNSGRSFSSLGVMGQFEQMVDKYLDSTDGILTIRGKGLDDQIKLQNDRIASLDIRLEAKRQTLAAQFLAMEQAIGHLQGQSSSLSSIQSFSSNR